MGAPTTRERILRTSLHLFNADGVASVSTNHVALELEISPGNLYYHFKNKADVVGALYQQFEQEWNPLLFTGGEGGAIDIEQLWFYLHISFELVSKYRFLFRDIDYLSSKVPHYEKKYRRMLMRTRESLVAILRNLAAHGLLAASLDDLKIIATNMLMIITYWVAFRRAIEAGSHAEGDRSEFTSGMFQVISILVPYISEGRREELRVLGNNYNQRETGSTAS